MISNQSNIISTIIVTIFVVHINTLPPPLPTQKKCLPTKYQEPHLLGNLDTRQKLIFSQYVVQGTIPFNIHTPLWIRFSEGVLKVIS